MVNTAAKHGFKRAQRVSEEIRKAISAMLIRGDLHDPRLATCTVTSVKLSDDLKHARVFFSVLAADVDHQDIERSFNRAAGFIKTEVGQQLKLRFTPVMKFIFDETLETAARIDNLLKNVRADEHENIEDRDD